MVEAVNRRVVSDHWFSLVALAGQQAHCLWPRCEGNGHCPEYQQCKGGCKNRQTIWRHKNNQHSHQVIGYVVIAGERDKRHPENVKCIYEWRPRQWQVTCNHLHYDGTIL